jgi:glycosyltransferase 2 family protein
VIEKTGFARILSALRAISIPLFLTSGALYIFSLYISSIRWRLLLPGEFALGRLFSLYLIGSFFNTLLPGIIGGDAVKAYYLYKGTGKGTPAVASVFMDRYIGYAALMCVGTAAFPFGLRYFNGSPVEWLFPLIVLIFAIGSILAYALRAGRRYRFIAEAYEYFDRCVTKRGTIVKTFFLSVFVQIINIVSVYLLIIGLEIDLPFLPLLIFIPVITTISTIPISISGLGVREASFILLFHFVGVDPVRAATISFAWFLTIATGSIPGLIEYLRHASSH